MSIKLHKKRTSYFGVSEIDYICCGTFGKLKNK